MSKPPTLSVVIPLHCEGSHLRDTLAIIRGHVASLDMPYEFVLVDDGSSDDTWSVVRSLSRARPEIGALRLSRNFGKEAAITAGLEMARGDAVIVIDGDLQHPPELIPEMVQLWLEEGAEVVDVVKRKRSAESFQRRVGSRVFGKLMHVLSGFDLSGASDFKLLDRKAVDALLRMQESQAFYRGMVAWLGFSHERISTEIPDRAGGTSAWSTAKLFGYALSALTSFSSLPLHVVTFIGGIFLVMAFGLGCWSLIRWAQGTAVTGFTTVILLQLLIGSIIMVSLGIIGQYLAHIYSEAKRRPRYVVTERIAGKVAEDEPAATPVGADW